MKLKICAALLRLMRPVANLLHRLWARPSPRGAWVSQAVIAPPRRPVPRIVWSYWHCKDLPPVVAACVANWRRHAPGYTIRMLHRDTALAELGGQPLPQAFDTWPAYRQADWLRVALVGRYGGLWLDASLFLTRSPEWLLALATRKRGFAGFHLRGGDPLADGPGAWPYLENWCFAAPPHDRFVLAWEAELRWAMSLGEATYLARLGNARDELLAGIDGPHYLVMHVAARVVLRRDGPFNLHLLPAEDSAYFYQSRTGWRRWRLMLALLGWGRRTDTPLVKLRGAERKRLDMQCAHEPPLPQSLVATELPELMARPRT
jgi:hypothetical protein